MSVLKYLPAGFFLAIVVLGAGATWAQDYPNKPIRLVTGGVGGGNDFAARLLAPRLAATLGQQVIVDNRATQLIATETVVRAAPDGYTLLIAASAFWIAPLLEKSSYDPIKDFSPIVLLVRSPQILVVHPSLPVKSVRDLMALAKAKPGALNYASGPSGAPNHLAPELFKAIAKVDIVRIPYKGAGPALIDLISGQVQLMFATTGSVAAHVKSGRLKALAVTSAQPSALVPGLPALSSSGVPGYESVGLLGMFAPSGTSTSTVKRLNEEIDRILKDPQVKERFLDSGVETVGGTSDEFAATMKSEIVRMGKVISSAGIRAE